MTTPVADRGLSPLYHVPRHPVRLVVERTGVTAHTLRAWERRYQVVNPSRSEGGHRLYSDRDVEHLRLLHLATEAGRSIGQVSGLSLPALRDLVAQDRQARPVEETSRAPSGAGASPTSSPAPALAMAMQAVEALDSQGLEAVLRRAAMALSVPVLLDEVVAPLFREIGERWRAGRLAPAFEHLATTVVRTTLARMIAGANAPTEAPLLLVATPEGQRHELGALIAATAAAAEGWRILYLGADLPADDVITAARQSGAAMIALSVVYPALTPGIVAEIGRVHAALPSVPVLAGGRAALEAAGPLGDAGVIVIEDLEGLRPVLRQSPA